MLGIVLIMNKTLNLPLKKLIVQWVREVQTGNESKM